MCCDRSGRSTSRTFHGHRQPWGPDLTDGGLLSHRLIRTRTDFWWATRKLAHRPPHTPHILTEEAVTELAEYIDVYAQMTPWVEGLADCVVVSPAAVRTLPGYAPPSKYRWSTSHFAT